MAAPPSRERASVQGGLCDSSRTSTPGGNLNLAGGSRSPGSKPSSRPRSASSSHGALGLHPGLLAHLELELAGEPIWARVQGPNVPQEATSLAAPGHLQVFAHAAAGLRPRPTSAEGVERGGEALEEGGALPSGPLCANMSVGDGMGLHGGASLSRTRHAGCSGAGAGQEVVRQPAGEQPAGHAEAAGLSAHVTIEDAGDGGSRFARDDVVERLRSGGRLEGHAGPQGHVRHPPRLPCRHFRRAPPAPQR
mmetsp:Transcript_152613/g.489386  ORF Transcript_152613/g.489386 Transcript_152613/m.489386 type:complete len:250 (+) Transcript_152613:78-827(+)